MPFRGTEIEFASTLRVVREHDKVVLRRAGRPVILFSMLVAAGTLVAIVAWITAHSTSALWRDARSIYLALGISTICLWALIAGVYSSGLRSREAEIEIEPVRRQARLKGSHQLISTARITLRIVEVCGCTAVLVGVAGPERFEWRKVGAFTGPSRHILTAVAGLGEWITVTTESANYPMGANRDFEILI